MTEDQIKLGIDFGGVITQAAWQNSNEDTCFIRGSVEAALHTPVIPGALEAIYILVSAFKGNVWIISKAGQRVEDRTRQWLDHNDFYRRTGLHRENTRFCRERPEKLDHCLELGITHFIDDRVDIMHILKGTVENLFLFGPYEKAESLRKWATPVENWTEAVQSILCGQKHT